MSECCPYCNYEYGSTYKNNRGLLVSRKKTKDHTIPKTLGGTGEVNNIVYCCRRCNSFKGELLLSEWRDLIAHSLANKDPQHGVVKRPGTTNLLIQYKQADLRTILNNLNKIIQ